MSFVFEPDLRPALPVAGEERTFPVRRIICAGANYAKHLREMGGEPGKDLPFFFFKPTDAIAANGATIAYPPHTDNLHYEVELVVAIGKAGFQVPESEAIDLVYGYAVGIDMTRRDLLKQLQQKHFPWEFGKAFDQSAPCGTIARRADTGALTSGRIWLAVNGEVRQDSDLDDLIWTVPQLIAHLSQVFELRPGDLIYTGTPSGVGPVVVGDVMTAAIDGLEGIEITIGQRMSRDGEAVL